MTSLPKMSYLGAFDIEVRVNAWRMVYPGVDADLAKDLQVLIMSYLRHVIVAQSEC